MNVNEAIWGNEYREFDTVNARTGAMDFTDPDYVFFPPFTKNNLCDGGSNPSGGALSNGCLYMGMINRPEYFNMEADFDKTICYCACVNPDLFICNYAAPMPAITDENTGAVTMPFKHMVNRSGAFSIALLDNYDYCVGKSSHTGNNSLIGTVHTPYYNQTSQIPKSFFEYVPNGVNNGSYDTSTNRNASNNNLFFSYWRDFGVRSLFCVIYVVYFDGTYNSTTGQPINVSDHKTLHWYETQTEEWKATHPLLAAFGRPYIRKNTNGLYTNERRNNHIIIPDFSRMQIDYAPENPLVWQPCIGSSGTTPENCFPIFGGYRCGMASTSGANAVAQFVSQLSTGGLCNQADIILGYGCRGVNENSGIASNSVGRRTFWLEMDGTAANLELIRKSMAGYGLFFADDVYNLANEGRDDDRWTDENMCLGVIDENGYTNGTYTRGSGNTAANNFLWKTVSESKYNPDRPPPSPENQYSTETTFNSIGDVATMTKRYVLTGATVKLLAQQLWTITENMISVGGNIDFSELSNKLLDQFLTSNPIDCIVSLQRYPMEIPAVGDTTIVLGKYDTSLHAKPMEKTAFFYLFYGNTIQPKFGDSFLDYQPFTKMELYVPFCGTIQINPADILNRKLNVQLVVDFTTGTATGFVMSDNLVIETVNGNVAIDIPVTGIQQTTVASNLYNAIAQRSNAYKQEDITGWNRVSFGGALEMFWGDAMGASDTFGIKGKKTLQREIAATNREKADYDLTHQSAPVHIIGSASPAGGWAIDLNCRLLIYYPTGDVILDGNPPKWNNLQLARYGRTTGFACCIEKAIGEMGSGLVVGTAPRLDLMTTNTLHNPATIEELDMIRAAIEEGIILPTITD